MKNTKKEVAEEFIENNCKNYKKNFYGRDLNRFADYCFRILEKKLLNINHFCYFLNYSFCDALKNHCYYINLSKSNRKRLWVYQKSIIKIYMYIDCIFIEIDNMKKFIKNGRKEV